MKNSAMVLKSILLLVLIAIAGAPQNAAARDNIYLGVDLGGLVMGFNTYPYREYVPVAYPPPERVWYPAHYRHYPPPPPVYYEVYERGRYSPRHHRSHYRRDGRW